MMDRPAPTRPAPTRPGRRLLRLRPPVAGGLPPIGAGRGRALRLPLGRAPRAARGAGASLSRGWVRPAPRRSVVVGGFRRSGGLRP